MAKWLFDASVCTKLYLDSHFLSFDLVGGFFPLGNIFSMRSLALEWLWVDDKAVGLRDCLPFLGVVQLALPMLCCDISSKLFFLLCTLLFFGFGFISIAFVNRIGFTLACFGEFIDETTFEQAFER
jgi:hypothetical protein